MYTITYYDIGWNIHAHRTEASSIEDAIQRTMAATRCTRDEIITIYTPQERTQS